MSTRLPGAPLDYSAGGEYLAFAEDPRMLDSHEVDFDAAGIPRMIHGEERRYNPVTICQCGLQEWSYAERSGDTTQRERALDMARWLLSAQDPESGAWLYDFEIAPAGIPLPVPWMSAMAQGQGMSLLTRAHAASGEDAFRTAALRALKPFERPVPEGGLVRQILGRLTFFEEYPTDPPTYVLNGFMYTLVGLHELAESYPDSAARGLFEAGEETLAQVLPLYDLGGASIYDLSHLTLPPREVAAASDLYQGVHVTLLDAINAIRPREVYGFYRDLWVAAIDELPGSAPTRPRRWLGALRGAR